MNTGGGASCRESGTLQPKCNYHHQNRRAYFTKEGHRSKCSFNSVLVLCLNLGRTYTFPLSKKKQAVPPIVCSFESALKELYDTICSNR